MLRVPARSRSVFIRVASVALLAALTASCSGVPVFTGATGGGSVGAGSQPMPPALVGNGTPAPTYQAAPITQAPVQTAALPPAGGPPTIASQPATVAAAAPAATPTASIITVESGDTLYSLSREYNVSVRDLAAANGLTITDGLIIGQQIVLPGSGIAAAAPAAGQQLGAPPRDLGTVPADPTTTATVPAAAAPVAATPSAGVSAGTQSHVVQNGETMYAIARTYGVSPTALAQANGMSEPGLVQIGQTLTIPAGARTVAAAAPAAAATPAATPAAADVADEAPVQVAAAAAATPPVASDAAPAAAAAPQVAALEPNEPAIADAASADGTTFRWPVRGRIIADFGTRASGERNDGINLSVPEGTSIRASEAGTVIYAGNELPSYGNLVLIEHADGWVTAYAHASEILVSRGQSVQRGETIALAGSTGGVSSPQVHFELRRGSTPVNPLDYLSE